MAERGWAAAPPAAPLVACAADATLAQLSTLTQPIVQGVAERGWAAAPPAAPLVACAADATLAQAAAAAVDADVHRCYVLGPGGRAAGVVTLADMLRALTA